MPDPKRAPVRDEFSWQSPVKDKDLTAPPGSPSAGDRYIVCSPATGAWAGHEKDIAEYTGSTWDFFTPKCGWQSDVLDEGVNYRFGCDSKWSLFVSPRTVDFPFRGATGPFVESSSQTYEVLYRWEFAGSDRFGVPIGISSIVWRESGANAVDVRVYDLNNALTIAEKTGIVSGSIATVDLGAVSNVPASKSIWEYQMKVGVGTKGRSSSLQVRW